MNIPFNEDPFQGQPGFGFGPAGFSPPDRRTLHDQRRQARREFRDHVREQRGAGGRGSGFGDPVFGGPVFGVPLFGGPPFEFGPGGGRRGGGRSKRGDVRAAILKLLAERPMHGYEMIQEISERSQQLWKPSPGSVYPTLQLLVDEGLIVATESEGSRKLFELTDEGRAAVDKIETAPWDEITEGADPGAVNLRSAVGQLFGAVRQAAHAATADQHQRVIDIVNNARREIYHVLGED